MNKIKKKELRPVMLAGTGSDVGKSVLATALCRIFLQDGYRPAPFKAQNMALNSYATPDGREIGRAQAVQAEAAGLAPMTDMNPLLLKPSSDHTSQVVLHGRPIGNRNAYDYFRREGRDELRVEVNAAFDRLAAQYNPIVMEGAGSISELNLKDTDLVNMPMARHADARVILVADIDRGGVFASCYGSIMLQTPEDRTRIAGILINKFRGDLCLFDEGRRLMEEVCGVPVLGVVPYLTDVHIEEEDSVSLAGKAAHAEASKVNIAVVRLHHLSNFTDFFALEQDPRIHLYYTRDKDELAQADIIIVPGSKSTIDDLARLHADGTAESILRARRRGATVIGICGGYQMLGQEVLDPEGYEGDVRHMNGLGLLPVRTVLTAEKVTRQVTFHFRDDGDEAQGYEIHQGRTESLDAPSPACHILAPESTPDGCYLDARCFGTYIHGILDNAPIVNRLLAPYLTKGSGAETGSFDYRAYKEQQYDLLAKHIRQHVDISRLYKILEKE